MSFDKIRGLMGRLHRDETGDIPVGTIVVIGLIVIPLVIMLITFRKDLTTFLKEQWDLISENPDKLQDFKK